MIYVYDPIQKKLVPKDEYQPEEKRSFMISDADKPYAGVPSGQQDGVTFRSKQHYNEYLKERGLVLKQ